MYRLFKNNEIKKLQSLFNIKISSIEEVEKSVNDTYKVTCNKGTFALRKSIITPYYGIRQTTSEYFLLKKFNEKFSLPIIKPYKSPKKEGDDIYFMTYWIFGDKFNSSDSQMISAAKYLANLYDKLEKLNFQLEESPGNAYIDDLLTGENSSHIEFKRYYEHVKEPRERENLSFLEYITQSVKCNSKEYPRKLRPKQILHGDPRAENFIFKGQDVLAIVDFQGVRRDYPISDVAWAISTGFCKNDLDQINLEKVKKFLDSYGAVRSIKGLEILPKIIKIRYLRSVETSYYFELIKKYSRPELVRKRTNSINMLRWLDSNQQKIEDLVEGLL